MFTASVVATFCQVAVIVSAPLLIGAIVNDAVPVAGEVVTEAGVNVLPSAEVSTTV